MSDRPIKDDRFWRLIPLIEASGAEQMAIDSWLLDQHVKGMQPSILRFYTWLRPTISLGYHQRQFPEHWNDLHWQGQRLELVCRPTGGRAVLHQGDLTYALITSGLSGSRRAVYRQLCQFLIKGWGDLGVALSFGAAGRGYIHNPNCFGTATAADLIMENGYKLIGSAQVYRDGCVLQHGSMRLRPNRDLFEKVFEEKLRPQSRLPNALLLPDAQNTIMKALEKAAAQSFDIDSEVRSLTPAEIEDALTHRPLRLDQRLS
ncbi:MAG: biotin/lipoate A/B protein ligase family protein [Phormidesmis sp.]